MTLTYNIISRPDPTQRIRITIMDTSNINLKSIELKVHFTTNHHDDHDHVSTNLMAQSRLEDYDYFTQVLSVDVWPKILSYVTEKTDLESAMNTCHLFHNILEPRAFSELIFPLLLLKKKMPHKTVLKCRSINQNAKSTVETVLFSVAPWFYPDSLWFHNLDRFITKRLPKLPRNVSPFIWNRAVLRASKPEEFPNILTLTKSYGTNLTELHLSMDMLPNAHFQLSQVLRNIPQIKNLNLRLSCQNFSQSLTYQTEEDPVQATLFPVLKNLTDLTIDFNQILDVNLPSRHSTRITALVSQFMQNLLGTYGPQLDSFSCDRALLSVEFLQDFFSLTLPNIKKFRVINKPLNETFDIIAQLRFPKLERLSFERKYEHENIPCSQSLLRMLGNFGGSLKELYCEGLAETLTLGDEIEIAIGNRKPLLKVTKLTVYWKCFDGDMWFVLRTILPNLRSLRFQPDLIREKAPVPAFNRREAYFKIFPQLEKLIWCVYGKEYSFIEKTFVRNIQLPLSKYYEVPKLACYNY